MAALGFYPGGVGEMFLPALPLTHVFSNIAPGEGPSSFSQYRAQKAAKTVAFSVQPPRQQEESRSRSGGESGLMRELEAGRCGRKPEL